MEQPERAIKLRRDELVEIKKLYETVMTFASHGMFYRSGRIVGDRLIRSTGTELGRVREALIREGWVTDISFEGEGCTISQAASSLVTEMFHGKTLADVEATSGEAILDILGRELAGTRLKCATLGLNTTREAVRVVRRMREEQSW